MELVDTQDEVFIVRIEAGSDAQSGPFGGDDATRTAVFVAAGDSGTAIKLEPASSGYGWAMLIQFLPLIFPGLSFIATISLAILAYKALLNKRVDK
jgi:hypothetical protein